MNIKNSLIIISLFISQLIYSQNNSLSVEKKLISIGNYSYSSSANLSYYKNNAIDSVFVLRYNGNKNYKFDNRSYIEINSRESLDTLYNEIQSSINEFIAKKSGSDSYRKKIKISTSTIQIFLFSYKKFGKIHYIMSLGFANSADIEDYKVKNPNWNYDNSERYKLTKKLFVDWYLCDNNSLDEFENTKSSIKQLFGKS
jgi:hypothetical protein